MQQDQQAPEYVTDGKHVYPYNEHLYELLARGELQVSGPPVIKAEPPELVALRTLARSKGYELPVRVTLEEAQQLYKAYTDEKARQEALSQEPDATKAKPGRRRAVQVEANPAVAETAGFPSA